MRLFIYVALCLFIQVGFSGATMPMKTLLQIQTAFTNNQPVVIGVIGDSTSCGYGANPGPTLWTNGLAYGYLQAAGVWGPNWTNDGSGVLIQTDGSSGLVSRDSSVNVLIPGVMQLLYQELKRRNASSELWNQSYSGGTSQVAIDYGAVTNLAAKTPKPDVIFISLGINDAKYGKEYTGFATWAANIRVLCQLCVDNNMLPIVVKENNTCYWDMSASLSPDQWTQTANWDVWMNQIDVIAAEYNTSVVDLYSITHPFDITKMYDPFHPNSAGYSAMYQQYLSALIGSPVSTYVDVNHNAYNGLAFSNTHIRLHVDSRYRNIPFKKAVL